VPIALKSGSLNVLETSGLVQACDGIDLPLPFSWGADKSLALPGRKQAAPLKSVMGNGMD